jgi:hypothetical protein
MAKKFKSSMEGAKHHYMRTSFWMKSENHWWESDLIGPATKKRFRTMVENDLKKHRNHATI